MSAETVIKYSKIGSLLKQGGDEKVIEVCGPHWDSWEGLISPCRLILAMEFEKYQPDSRWKYVSGSMREHERERESECVDVCLCVCARACVCRRAHECGWMSHVL